MRKGAALQVVTANRLSDGLVLWRTAAGTWSPRLADAQAYDAATFPAALQAAEEDHRARIVVEPYGAAVAREGDTLRLLTMRERIRAEGPSIVFGGAA